MLNSARFISNGGEGTWLQQESSPIAKDKVAWSAAAWFKPSELVTGTILGWGKSAASGYTAALAMTSAGKAFTESTGASISTATTTANVWAHFGAVSSATPTIASFLNGVKSATASGGSQEAYNRLTLGALMVNGSIISQTKGWIAHAAIWNVELTTQEMESLAAGLPPIFVRPSALVWYAPLYNPAATGNEIDLIAATALTLKGNTALAEAGEGPPKFFLPDPPFVSTPVVGGGGGKKLTLELAETVAPTEKRAGADSMKRAETLTLAEKRVLGDLLRRTDTLTLSEKRTVAAALKRADALASVAESRSKRPGLRRADAITAAEALKKLFGEHRADTFALADALRRGAALRRSDAVAPTEKQTHRSGVKRADSVLLTELLKHGWSAKRTLGDSFHLSETFVEHIGKALVRSDPVALSDALVRVWAAHVGLADHLAPTEARKLRAALKRADTAAVVDVVRRNAGPHRKDSLSVSDARRLAAQKKLPETISFTDAVKLIPHHVLGTSDSAVVADAVKKAWAAHLARADSVALTDVAKRTAGKHLGEHFAATEANAHKWAALRKATDVFAVVDAIESFTSKGTSPHEHAVVTDAISHVWRAVIKRADSVAFVDSSRRQLRKVLADHIAAGDARHSLFAEALEDALHSSDQMQLKAGKRRSDAVSLGDARRAGAALKRSDGVGAADLLRHDSRLHISDHILPFDGHLKNSRLTPRDSIRFSDALSTLRGLGISIDEALHVADGLRRNVAIALVELAELIDKVEPRGEAANLAILTLVDLLSTAAALDDVSPTQLVAEDRLAVALVLADEVDDDAVDDRRSTTLSVEDGLA